MKFQCFNAKTVLIGDAGDYKTEIEIIDELSFVKSSLYTLDLFGEGDYELWVQYSDENIELLKTTNLIWLEDEVSGLIESFKSEIDSKGVRIIKVKGSLAESMLRYRETKDATSLSPSPSLFYSKYACQLAREVSGPTATCVSERTIPGMDVMNISTIPAIGPVEEYTVVGPGNYFELIRDLSIDYGFYFKIVTDMENEVLRFEVYEGINRTDPSKDTYVVIDSDIITLGAASYSFSKQNELNFAYTRGAPHPSSGQIIDTSVQTFVGEINGFDVKEIFIDNSNLSWEVDGRIVTSTEYEGMLINSCINVLAEVPLLESYEASFVENENDIYKFKRDYNLGDILLVRDRRIGIEIQAVVTGYEKALDESGETSKIVIGFLSPTITRYIKQQNKLKK